MEVTLVLNSEDIRRVALRTVLRSLRDRGRDFRPAYSQALDVIFDHETDLFRQQGRTAHEPQWAPLTEKYAKWKARHAPNAGLLLLSSRLFRQLSGISGDHYERRLLRQLTFGSNYEVKWDGGRDDLGGIHMSGRPGGGGSLLNTHMAARPPIRTTDRLAGDLADVFMDHLLGGLPR
jgi:hypothetical protein